MNSVLTSLAEAFSYDFTLKALAAGSLVALCCAFLGMFLVLRRLSMIGDGLAHVSFASVALALLVSASPLVVSIPVVIVASLLILKLSESRDGFYGDAAIGLVSSVSIALGVVIASVSRGFNVDLFSYLFGSILAISTGDVILSVVLSVVVIAVISLLYRPLFSMTFDEEFARVTGLKVGTMNRLLAVLTSVTIVLGIRVVGTMLVSSLIVFPTVTALQFGRGFRQSMAIAALVAVFSVVAGVLGSFLLDLPTGGVIVLLQAVAFTGAWSWKRLARR